ncbi:MAG: transketolase, partial [Verrucomicrobiales bacterium]
MTESLELKSLRYRRNILRSIMGAKAGHTGGSLSCVDILSVLYNRVLRVSPETIENPERDRYFQ